MELLTGITVTEKSLSPSFTLKGARTPEIQSVLHSECSQHKRIDSWAAGSITLSFPQGQAYAIGFSGEINAHEFDGNQLGLIFSDILDASDSDITAAANTQRTAHEVIQYPESLLNIALHININVQGAQESRTLEVQLRKIRSGTDDVVVDFAAGQGGSGSGMGYVTIDFRWDYWRPKPNEKYYFAIVGEREAYNQADWRNRNLEGFLQIVRKG